MPMMIFTVEIWKSEEENFIIGNLQSSSAATIADQNIASLRIIMMLEIIKHGSTRIRLYNIYGNYLDSEKNRMQHIIIKILILSFIFFD